MYTFFFLFPTGLFTASTFSNISFSLTRETARKQGTGGNDKGVKKSNFALTDYRDVLEQFT